jgi:hypothetical protein
MNKNNTVKLYNPPNYFFVSLERAEVIGLNLSFDQIAIWDKDQKIIWECEYNEKNVKELGKFFDIENLIISQKPPSK